MNKIKNIILVSLTALLILTGSVLCIFGKSDGYSDSERRDLAKFPPLSLSTIKDGSFMRDFESYATDNFPARDAFRTIKAFSELKVFNKSDNNGLYVKDGYIAKIDYPLNEDMVTGACDKFEFIYNSFIKDNNCNVFLSVIPDKNFFLAKENGYLSVDFDSAVDIMKENMSYAQYIDILPLLSLEDYYLTDTHWKQENITDIASALCEKMGATLSDEYTEIQLDNPFYGVYYCQLALPVKPDRLSYLTNDTIENCTVTSYATGMAKPSVMYNLEKADGKDPYELFLSGSEPLLVIENPDAHTDKHLILFRDSFGSSIAPLFAEAYSKITVVDIRYVQSAVLGSFIDFSDSDVLFLYSTLLLNNSSALR